MPMNTQTVTSIMFLTWSSVLPSEAPSMLVLVPQKSVLKMPALKPTAATAMKVRIGTTLAIVTMVLTHGGVVDTAQGQTQLTIQRTTDATTIADSVLPPSNVGQK